MLTDIPRMWACYERGPPLRFFGIEIRRIFTLVYELQGPSRQPMKGLTL